MKPVKSYELTRLAARDLEGIARFRLFRWGRVQQRAYMMKLRQGIDFLVENPMLGIDRNAVRPDVRSLHVGRYQIFYRVGQNKIVVVRILHENMDPLRHRLK